jgi:hypothetical protein
MSVKEEILTELEVQYKAKATIYKDWIELVVFSTKTNEAFASLNLRRARTFRQDKQLCRVKASQMLDRAQNLYHLDDYQVDRDVEFVIIEK